ncbi:hypothetical protein BHM03_00056830 [Ensete ventricosum]|nr:hypothetical protein BHM03_00056830 [Ensete ventricosum]
MHLLQNSKYLPFPTYLAMGSRMSTVSQKKPMVINFTQIRVSIGFSSIISKIKNSIQSQRICP